MPTRVMRLAVLAPDIIEAILQGKQRPNLTAQALLRGVEIPPVLAGSTGPARFALAMNGTAKTGDREIRTN